MHKLSKSDQRPIDRCWPSLLAARFVLDGPQGIEQAGEAHTRLAGSSLSGGVKLIFYFFKQGDYLIVLNRWEMVKKPLDCVTRCEIIKKR